MVSQTVKTRGDERMDRRKLLSLVPAGFVVALFGRFMPPEPKPITLRPGDSILLPCKSEGDRGWVLTQTRRSGFEIEVWVNGNAIHRHKIS
jgi:hypothetical protein